MKVEFVGVKMVEIRDRSGQLTYLELWGVEPATEDSGLMAVRQCRVCGCTDLDCSGCIARTGQPCWWVSNDLCSACKA